MCLIVSCLYLFVCLFLTGLEYLSCPKNTSSLIISCSMCCRMQDHLYGSRARSSRSQIYTDVNATGGKTAIHLLCVNIMLLFINAILSILYFLSGIKQKFCNTSNSHSKIPELICVGGKFWLLLVMEAPPNQTATATQKSRFIVTKITQHSFQVN